MQKLIYTSQFHVSAHSLLIYSIKAVKKLDAVTRDLAAKQI